MFGISCRNCRVFFVLIIYWQLYPFITCFLQKIQTKDNYSNTWNVIGTILILIPLWRRREYSCMRTIYLFSNHDIARFDSSMYHTNRMKVGQTNYCAPFKIFRMACKWSMIHCFHNNRTVAHKSKKIWQHWGGEVNLFPLTSNKLTLYDQTNTH